MLDREGVAARRAAARREGAAVAGGAGRGGKVAEEEILALPSVAIYRWHPPVRLHRLAYLCSSDGVRVLQVVARTRPRVPIARKLNRGHWRSLSSPPTARRLREVIHCQWSHSVGCLALPAVLHRAQ